MAKFRYYIVCVPNGNIVGTNDKDTAEETAGAEDNFVIDTETNEWIQADLYRMQILGEQDGN